MDATPPSLASLPQATVRPAFTKTGRKHRLGHHHAPVKSLVNFSQSHLLSQLIDDLRPRFLDLFTGTVEVLRPFSVQSPPMKREANATSSISIEPANHWRAGMPYTKVSGGDDNDDNAIYVACLPTDDCRDFLNNHVFVFPPPAPSGKVLLPILMPRFSERFLASFLRTAGRTSPASPWEGGYCMMGARCKGCSVGLGPLIEFDVDKAATQYAHYAGVTAPFEVRISPASSSAPPPKTAPFPSSSSSSTVRYTLPHKGTHLCLLCVIAASNALAFDTILAPSRCEIHRQGSLQLFTVSTSHFPTDEERQMHPELIHSATTVSSARCYSLWHTWPLTTVCLADYTEPFPIYDQATLLPERDAEAPAYAIPYEEDPVSLSTCAHRRNNAHPPSPSSSSMLLCHHGVIYSSAFTDPQNTPFRSGFPELPTIRDVPLYFGNRNYTYPGICETVHALPPVTYPLQQCAQRNVTHVCRASVVCSEANTIHVLLTTRGLEHILCQIFRHVLLQEADGGGGGKCRILAEFLADTNLDAQLYPDAELATTLRQQRKCAHEFVQSLTMSGNLAFHKRGHVWPLYMECARRRYLTRCMPFAQVDALSDRLLLSAFVYANLRQFACFFMAPHVKPASFRSDPTALTVADLWFGRLALFDWFFFAELVLLQSFATTPPPLELPQLLQALQVLRLECQSPFDLVQLAKYENHVFFTGSALNRSEPTTPFGCCHPSAHKPTQALIFQRALLYLSLGCLTYVSTCYMPPLPMVMSIMKRYHLFGYVLCEDAGTPCFLRGDVQSLPPKQEAAAAVPPPPPPPATPTLPPFASARQRLLYRFQHAEDTDRPEPRPTSAREERTKQALALLVMCSQEHDFVHVPSNTRKNDAGFIRFVMQCIYAQLFSGLRWASYMYRASPEDFVKLNLDHIKCTHDYLLYLCRGAYAFAQGAVSGCAHPTSNFSTERLRQMTNMAELSILPKEYHYVEGGQSAAAAAATTVVHHAAFFDLELERLLCAVTVRPRKIPSSVSLTELAGHMPLAPRSRPASEDAITCDMAPLVGALSEPEWLDGLFPSFFSPWGKGVDKLHPPLTKILTSFDHITLPSPIAYLVNHIFLWMKKHGVVLRPVSMDYIDGLLRNHTPWDVLEMLGFYKNWARERFAAYLAGRAVSFKDFEMFDACFARQIPAEIANHEEARSLFWSRILQYTFACAKHSCVLPGASSTWLMQRMALVLRFGPLAWAHSWIPFCPCCRTLKSPVEKYESENGYFCGAQRCSGTDVAFVKGTFNARHYSPLVRSAFDEPDQQREGDITLLSCPYNYRMVGGEKLRMGLARLAGYGGMWFDPHLRQYYCINKLRKTGGADSGNEDIVLPSRDEEGDNGEGVEEEGEQEKAHKDGGADEGEKKKRKSRRKITTNSSSSSSSSTSKAAAAAGTASDAAIMATNDMGNTARDDGESAALRENEHEYGANDQLQFLDAETLMQLPSTGSVEPPPPPPSPTAPVGCCAEVPHDVQHAVLQRNTHNLYYPCSAAKIVFLSALGGVSCVRKPDCKNDRWNTNCVVCGKGTIRGLCPLSLVEYIPARYLDHYHQICPYCLVFFFREAHGWRKILNLSPQQTIVPRTVLARGVSRADSVYASECVLDAVQLHLAPPSMEVSFFGTWLSEVLCASEVHDFLGQALSKNVDFQTVLTRQRAAFVALTRCVDRM